MLGFPSPYAPKTEMVPAEKVWHVGWSIRFRRKPRFDGQCTRGAWGAWDRWWHEDGIQLLSHTARACVVGVSGALAQRGGVGPRHVISITYTIVFAEAAPYLVSGGALLQKDLGVGVGRVATGPGTFIAIHSCLLAIFLYNSLHNLSRQMTGRLEHRNKNIDITSMVLDLYCTSLSGKKIIQPPSSRKWCFRNYSQPVGR